VGSGEWGGVRGEGNKWHDEREGGRGQEGGIELLSRKPTEQQLGEDEMAENECGGNAHELLLRIVLALPNASSSGLDSMMTSLTL